MKQHRLSKLAASVVVAFGLAGAANAAYIQGVINFAGTVTLDAPLLTATQVTTWDSAAAAGPITLDFATFVTAGDAATFTAPWTFNSGALAGLWSVGGFTFDLTQSAIAFQGVIGPSEFLNVTGTGMLTGNGFTSTPGTWSFTSQFPGNSSTTGVVEFSFSATNVAVPDGGTTMALFGVSLLGLGAVRRKLCKH